MRRNRDSSERTMCSNEAVAHHRAGRLEAAERLYRQVDSWDVRAADALHLRGVVALELDADQCFLALIEEAIAARPEEPAYRLSLGQVHAAAGRVEEAVSCLSPGDRVDPLLPDAWLGLGRALLYRQTGTRGDRGDRKSSGLRPITPMAARIWQASWSFAETWRKRLFLARGAGSRAGACRNAQQSEKAAASALAGRKRRLPRPAGPWRLSPSRP